MFLIFFRYLDIAVGAYKSGHAVVLRGRPVVKTELEIQTTPNILQRDAKEFLINVCPRYIGYKVPSSQGKLHVCVLEDGIKLILQWIMMLRISLCRI